MHIYIYIYIHSHPYTNIHTYMPTGVGRGLFDEKEMSAKEKRMQKMLAEDLVDPVGYYVYLSLYLIYINMCMLIYICIQNTFIFLYTYSYIYIHIHIYTYMYTYIYIQEGLYKHDRPTKKSKKMR